MLAWIRHANLGLSRRHAVSLDVCDDILADPAHRGRLTRSLLS